MFRNQLLQSKTFVAIIALIVVDTVMRAPFMGLTPEDVAQVHELVLAGMITFGSKEAITNFATKGESSGTFKAK